jgi:hypothetical protein
MAHDVFISHSSKDRGAADAVCAALEAHGVTCWMAARDILPSADWGASIVRAIADARLFLLIFSNNANMSQHVVREVERAVNRGLPIVPVRIEEIAPSDSLEYFLNTPHWLDAHKPPLDQHLDYVVRVAHLLLSGSQGPTPASSEPLAASVASPASPPEPNQRRRPAPLALIVGVVVLIGVLAAAGATTMMYPRMLAPSPVATGGGPDAWCLASTPSLINPATCQAILNQNPTWQGCAASYADGDVASRISLARKLVAEGHSGSDLYEANPAFRDYGAISHYWEMFGECVTEGDVKFADISGSIAFPQFYWDKTRPLRRAIGPNWNGAGQALPDFMSNFRALCRRYKAAREAARPAGGESLDCSF